MNGWTRFFLVLLRLAIGWHFLIEGLDKLHSIEVGPTSTNRPFSSEGYLKESAGPLAPYFRELAGDTDEMILERLTLVPVSPGQDPEGSARSRLSPTLEAEWDAAFDKLTQGLPDQQRAMGTATLEQQKELLARWLFKGEKVVKKPFPSGAVDVNQTTRQRVEDLRDKLRQLRDLQEKEMPAFGKGVGAQRLASLKADVRRMRSELLADLAELTTSMQDAVRKSVGIEALPKAERTWHDWSRLDWLDRGASWGITIVGACLIAGLFTRLSCVGGAAFLLMFYLAMLPFPGVPESPKAEGHYLYINKNTIEMLALLALATTRSGKWLGLDGLVQFLFPWNYRKKNPLAG